VDAAAVGPMSCDSDIGLSDAVIGRYWYQNARDDEQMTIEALIDEL